MSFLGMIFGRKNGYWEGKHPSLDQVNRAYNNAISMPDVEKHEVLTHLINCDICALNATDNSDQAILRRLHAR